MASAVVAAGFASLGIVTTAHANPCPIALHGKGADPAWADAVARARRTLADDPASDSDCQSLEVIVERDDARVELTTVDGRHAQRPLKRPDDLLPTVSALMVTVQTATETKVAALEPPAPASQRAPAENSSSEGHLTVTARTGLRLDAAPGSWVLPQLGAGIGYTGTSWEIGVFGSLVPDAWFLANTKPAGFHYDAWAAALSGGLRVERGSLIWLGGLDAGVAFVREQVSSPADTSSDQGDVMMEGDIQDESVTGSTVSIRPVELRFGVHAGFAFPRRSRLRFRPQITLSGTPFRFSDRRGSGSPLPALPNLSGELAIGVEGDLL